MMRQLFIWLLLVTPICVNAQPDWIRLSDEELQGYRNRLSPNDPQEVPLFNELAFRAVLANNLDTAKAFALRAGASAQRNGDERGLSDSYVVLGHVARQAGQLEEAETYYVKALPIRIGIGDQFGVASCYNSLGILVKDKESQYLKARDYFQSGLEFTDRYIRGKENDIEKGKSLKAKILNNLGDLLMRMSEYEAALVQFQASEGLRAPSQLAPLYLNEGICLQEIGLVEKAASVFRKSLALFKENSDIPGSGKAYLQLGVNATARGQLDSALLFYDQALALGNQLQEKDHAIALRNKGGVYKEKKAFDLAERHFRESLREFEQMENYAEIAMLYFDMGGINMERSRYKEAISNFEKSKSILDTLPLPELRHQLYYQLSSAYSLDGRFDEALKISQKNTDLLLSLQEKREGGLRQQNQQTTEQLLQKEILTRVLEKRNRNLLISGVMGLALVFSLFGVFVLLAYNNQQKKNLELEKERSARQKLGIALKQLEVEQSYQQLEKTDRLLAWISKELHDRLGSMLSTIKLYFVDLDSKIDQLRIEGGGQVQKINSLLDEVCDEVRRISRGATPQNLANHGLVSEIDRLVQHLRNTERMNVEFTTHGMKNRLEVGMERKIYRMIHILINNILVHAKASWFSLQINKFDDYINIMVEDNGVGFDRNQVPGTSTGLKNLESLAAELGGNVICESRPGQGTMVAIEIPVFKDANESGGELTGAEKDLPSSQENNLNL